MLGIALGTDPDVDGMLLRGFVTLLTEVEGTEAEHERPASECHCVQDAEKGLHFFVGTELLGAAGRTERDSLLRLVTCMIG